MNNRSPFFHLLLAVLGGLSLVALAFGSGYVAAASFQPRQSAQEDAPLPTPLNLFQEAWDLVEQGFYGPLPGENERVYGAVRGLLGTLDDPYTVLVEPVPHQLEQDNLRGSYGGIGVNLSRDADGQVVLSPFRDSPAAAAGILEGDLLLAVNGVPVTPEMDLSLDVAARIRGDVGTDVTLTVRRGEATLTFTITREEIETPSVTWRLLEGTPSLGYVQISSFTDRTADELREGLDELLVGGVEGLVLDLRGNGGGLLQAALDVADQFLDGGLVLYEGRKGQPEKPYLASPGGQALEIPLAVLVDGGTASASEIVAGALQDRERGMLIGESTFGKGSVQLIFDLSDGSSLHVTASRWYTPKHHQLDGVGLAPDLIVTADPHGEVDAPLERAISFLQGNE